MGPITRQHLENLWSPADPRTQQVSHFTPNITKLRGSLKLEALLSLLVVLEAQDHQHLHAVHASLHLPLDPESLEHHGPPNMLPKEPKNQRASDPLGSFRLGLGSYPFSFESGFSFRSGKSDISLSKTQTLSCRVLVWFDRLTANETRITKV